MPVKKLKAFLNQHHIKYVSIIHSPAYTAQEIAASAHIPGQELAKTVILNVDGKDVMAVLPASYQVDFQRLRKALGARQVELTSERKFEQLFPDCEVGAMPPFGNLYDMEVYVAERLTDDDEIVFNAGTHSELIRLPYADFARLVKPRVLRFSTTEAALPW